MPTPADLTAEAALALRLGLTPEEWQDALRILDGRAPSRAELGVFSALWSERWSRRSTRIHLQNLPAEGPRVLQGHGSAGVLDLGDGQAVALAVACGNDASTASPYQGAAGSVAGALMQVFTAGARPMANVNALRFGDPDAPGMRDLIRGVASGLGGHGNCMGVPMLAGDVAFAPCHDGNIVVNTFALGVLGGDRIRNQAPGPGSQLLYLGARTGRDGLPQPEPAEGEEAADGSAPPQPCDPFTGKLLLEACLEVLGSDGILAIQGMGIAGLAGCAFELAARAGVGLELRLDDLPVREEGLTPFELLLAETQDRLLVAVRPGTAPELKRILFKWGLEAALIGEVTASGRVVGHWQGEAVLDLPVQPLADAPALDRPQLRPACLDRTQPLPADLEPGAVEAELDRLLASPNLASKRWIFGQFDDTVRGNTLLGHGSAGAGLFRIPGTAKAIALKTDGNGRFAHLDPFWGAAHAVAEACRNLACVGAEPIGIAPCLNGGDPAQPETMWALAQGILGIRQACLALDVPVVCSGVSLGNLQDGPREAGAIQPTPVIGAVGLIEDCSLEGDGNRYCDAAFQGPGHGIYLLGESRDELGGSEHLLLRTGSVSGPCPELRLDQELQLQACVREGIRMGLIRSAQDTSEGGLLVAVLESAFGGNLGCRLDLAREGLRLDALLFGETAGRIVVSVEPDGETSLTKLARTHRVNLTRLGTTGGPRIELRVDGQPVFDTPASRLKERYASALEASLRDR